MEDIRDIKGILYFKEVNWFLVIALAVILIAAALFIYKMIKNRNKPKTPFETAMKELDDAKNILLPKGDIKAYYVKISDAVRKYVETVFNLRAPEMTTEEFLVYLEGYARFSEENKNILKGFLNACDLVKFAKYAPTKEEAENVYITARKFIEDTNVRV